MHELSLCQAIVDTVRQHADERPVRRVQVRIGHLRQVVPDSLLFSWEVMTADTELAGSALELEQVVAVVACRRCGARTELDVPLMVCSRCEGHDVEVVQGEELQIVAIDVVEEVR